MGWTWWTKRPLYVRVFARELTAIFIAAYLVLFVVLLHKAGQSEDTYLAYRDFLWHPIMIFVHCIMLVFALYHTVTWFHLTPKAIVIRIGEYKVPGFFIIAQQYAGWLVISAIVILWVVLA